MLRFLSNIIEKKPWLVITVVLLITLGMASLIPSIEMKTDFNDFMPDDEVVEANMRIMDYFGETQQLLFIYVDSKDSGNTISTQSLREQYTIEQKLLDNKYVKSVASFPLVLDQISFMEYSDSIGNLTEDQLKIVLNDLLDEPSNKIKVLDIDDSNEKIDYNKYPRFTKGKSEDSIDIKNCEVEYNDDELIFRIHVYDLSTLSDNFEPIIPLTNVMEWYVDFDNKISFGEEFDIDYKIAAHVEPKNPLWEVGRGFFNNIKILFNNLKNKELFNNYKKEVYLWIKPPGMDMYFPMIMENGTVNFDKKQNQIEIKVTREEIGNFGIATRVGSFELPAKLYKFKTGFRYYQSSFLKLPWNRVVFNTSYLFEKISNIQNKPLVSNIANNLLERFGGMSFEDFDMFLEDPDGQLPISEKLALKDIESSWVETDIAPDTDFVEGSLFIRPKLFDDIKVAAEGFLSKDYLEDGKPKASLMIVSLDASMDYDETIEINNEMVDFIEKLNDDTKYVTLEVTGEGVISTQMNEVTTEANTIIMPMIFIIILSVLYISFRRPSYVVLPIICLLISTIWLFGTMVILGIAFSTIAVALVPLIMGLGVDYSVHISHNYKTELSKGRTPGEAIKKSVLEIGTAMFLAMLTTVIAFLSFLSSNIPPIRDFGILLALGILYTFITSITILAAIRYVVDKRKDMYNNNKKQFSKLNNFMGLFAQKILCHQKIIIIVLVILTLIFAYGAVNIKSGFDFNSFIPDDNPAMKVFGKIEDDFPFSGQDQEFILLEGDVATVESIKAIKQTHENFKDDKYVSRNVDGTVKDSSIYTIINQAVDNNETLLGKFNIDESSNIPKTDNDLKKLIDYLYENENYKTQVQSVISKEKNRYNAAIIRVYVAIESEGKKADEFSADMKSLSEELNDDIEDYGDVKATVTGPYIITDRITGSMTESQIYSTLISMVLASIVLILVYRRPTLGFIALIPVLISIVWILGTMYFIDYTLNILTITVTSITIGIGIDYAIHATERFRLVADRTGDPEAAVCETIQHTGGALLIAALTTTLGFIMLVFAPIPPQVQFGVITSMTIVYSFITSVLLLPLILVRWAKWTKKRKGYIISPNKQERDELDDIKSCECEK